MSIQLNFSNIADELFALTALRARNNPAAELPAILSRDQLPALRVLVRTVFSKLVARLLPYIADASTDEANPGALRPYNPREQLLLKIDFGEYTAGLPSGSLLILCRQLEHLLAVMTLAEIHSEIGAYTEEIEALLQSATDFLSIDSAPSVLSIRNY